MSALQNELRNKLNELEKEIKRYRTENAAIEKLRKEREHVSVRGSEGICWCV